MGSMPDQNQKVDLLTQLEEKAESKEFLKDLQWALTDPTKSLVEIGRDLELLTEADAMYLKRDWFEPPFWWWPALQPIQPILRQGLRIAVEKALAVSPPSAIRFSWSPGVGKFEVGITWNPNSKFLNFHIYSPDIPTTENPFPRAERSTFSSNERLDTDECTIRVKRVGPEVSPSPNVQILQIESKIIAERVKTAS